MEDYSEMFSVLNLSSEEHGWDIWDQMGSIKADIDWVLEDA